MSAYNPATKEFSLDQCEEFYGRKDQMVSVDIPVRLRRNTFYRLSILSPTFSPKDLYGSPDTRRLGLAVAALRLDGRPYENLADNEAALGLAGSIAANSSQPAYTFPILS